MNNIHGACLNMDIPERQGSGFVGHHAPNFINFNDSGRRSSTCKRGLTARSI